MKIQKELIMFKCKNIASDQPRKGYIDKSLYKDMSALAFIDFAPIYDYQDDWNKEKLKDDIEKKYKYNKLNIQTVTEIEIIPGTEIICEIETDISKNRI